MDDHFSYKNDEQFGSQQGEGGSHQPVEMTWLICWYGIWRDPVLEKGMTMRPRVDECYRFHWFNICWNKRCPTTDLTSLKLRQPLKISPVHSHELAASRLTVNVAVLLNRLPECLCTCHTFSDHVPPSGRPFHKDISSSTHWFSGANC